MTILEVMGAGVPVVATAVGGVPEIAAPPSAGWLVPAERPDALALTVGESLSDERQRRSRANEALRRLNERYGPLRWVAQHIFVYRFLSRTKLDGEDLAPGAENIYR